MCWCMEKEQFQKCSHHKITISRHYPHLRTQAELHSIIQRWACLSAAFIAVCTTQWWLEKQSVLLLAAMNKAMQIFLVTKKHTCMASIYFNIVVSINIFSCPFWSISLEKFDGNGKIKNM